MANRTRGARGGLKLNRTLGQSPRHTARILGGQNPKEKCPFLFQKKSVAHKSEKQGTLFFGVAE